MQTFRTPSSITSAWQKLKNHEITCEEALKLLVDEQRVVNLDLLSDEVSTRFLRSIPNRSTLPPVIPLLLWRNCYYLGSPVVLKKEDIKQLSDRTGTDIRIIPIASKSYRAWHLSENFKPGSISAATVTNPLTDENEPEDISETTEIYLRKADIAMASLGISALFVKFCKFSSKE